jgi:hypothetical protein
MSGYALACFRGRYNNKHGLYVSEDFSLTGKAPTWTLYNTGLPETQGVLNNRPVTMAVDPFAPLQRQWVNVDNNSIWHRDTTLGDEWIEVLSMVDASRLIDPLVDGDDPENPMPTDWMLSRSPRLSWISCDPTTPGRIFSVYSFINAQAAWWKPDYRLKVYSGWVVMSEDYGETWSVPATIGTGSNYGVVRGAGEVQGFQSSFGAHSGLFLWAGGDIPLLVGGGGVIRVSTPVLLEEGAKNTGALKFSGWNAYVKTSPETPMTVYTSHWGADSPLLLVSGLAGDSPRLGYTRADRNGFGLDSDPIPWLPLGSIHRITSSDHHWISRFGGDWAQISLFQRYLREDGRLFVTNSRWEFDTWSFVHPEGYLVTEWDQNLGAINPEPVTLFPGAKDCRNLVASEEEDGPVFFTRHRAVYGLHNDQSTDPIRLFETPSSPSLDAGAASFYGLYVDPDILNEPSGQPYVYSVDLGDEGTDDPDSSGLHLHGDNAAYDTEWQATEHARDIKTAAFTYHNPYPGNQGDAPVSDGEGYVSTPVLTLEPQITLYPADGTGVRYEFSIEGLNEAGEDAEAGDKIETKGAGTLTGDLVLADGVEYIGSKHVLIVGTVYHGVGSIFTGFTVEATETDDDAVCIIGASEGICYLYDCIISASSQSGDAFALSAELGGSIHAVNCDLKALSVSGDGYIGRSLRGKIKAMGGKVHASTDVWYIGG